MAQKQETCFAEGGWRDTIKGGMEKMKDANIVGDDCVKLLGWFECELVDYLFKKVPQKYDGFSDIDKAFCAKVFGKDAFKAASPTPDESIVESKAFTMLYDSEGNPVAPKKHSFMTKHAAKVQENKLYTNISTGMFHHLHSIDDDATCLVSALTYLGKPDLENQKKIDGDVFIKEHKLCDKPVKIIENFVESCDLPARDTEHVEQQVKEALFFASKSFSVRAKCVIWTSPVRKLIALEDIETLCMVPTSKTVCEIENSEHLSTVSKIIVQFANGDVDRFFGTVSSNPTKDSACSYFMATPTADPDGANVHHVTKFVNLFAPSIGKTAKLACSVGVPCLVNTRAIKKGEEIMYFKGNAKVESTSSTYDAPQGSSSAAGKRKATQAETVSKKQKAKPGQEGVSKKEKK